jgi:phage repressor protein C with HTH and peptisase S24 domain
MNKNVTISSDNGAYPSWPDCDPAKVELVGRAVWVGRRLT